MRFHRIRYTLNGFQYISLRYRQDKLIPSKHSSTDKGFIQTKYEQFLIKAESLGIIEQKKDKESLNEREKKEREAHLQEIHQITPLHRPQSSPAHVMERFGAKEKAKNNTRWNEVEKYYKFFFGKIKLRHWRVEVIYGIPMKYWMAMYLVFGSILVFFMVRYLSTPTDINSIKGTNKYDDIMYIIDKLNNNSDLNDIIGEIKSPKISKLNPADKSNFRSRFVTEIWFHATKLNERLRLIVIFDKDETLQELNRFEIHTDTEIIKIDFNDLDNKDLNDLNVVLCPPDLFPLMEFFTQSKREIWGYLFRYVWPIAPIIAVIALFRWHYNTPPGLANYILDQLRNNIVIKRALGSPIHLHSDQWKGNLTSRSCNIKVMLHGSKYNGTVNVVGYRENSKRWLFPNCVLMMDDVKHDHYREIQLQPFNTK